MRLGSQMSPPIDEWAVRVRKQLAAELDGIGNVTLIALAGEQYRTMLRDVPWPYEIPMKGLGIGQQPGWLTRKLDDDSR
jgi:hypothetical protein